MNIYILQNGTIYVLLVLVVIAVGLAVHTSLIHTPNILARLLLTSLLSRQARPEYKLCRTDTQASLFHTLHRTGDKTNIPSAAGYPEYGAGNSAALYSFVLVCQA